MPPTFRLPGRGAITPVDPASEPTRYYYWPVVGWFYRKRLCMIVDRLAGRRHRRLLEVAYGSGIFLPSLAPLCDALHGIDRHRHGVKVRHALRQLDVRAQILPADALALPYRDAAFDAVVSVSMLEHLTDPGLAVAEMARVLTPGGTLALGFPCRNPWMDAFFRLLGFNPREIHPSSHRDILDAVDRLGLAADVEAFPRWLPLDFALYCVCTIHGPETRAAQASHG
ncbi:MAG: class I SAM-dependent methyltransferase [Candidatus Hydrogenedentes bacterium]|nr:class I SAM-dependent methyltransferase [Candidatus Hydrogenedentota bacterium]